MTGNIRGLKSSERRSLERTYRRRVPPREIVSLELAQHLCSLSRKLTRQVGALITRKGTIRNVVVGDAVHLMLPDIGRLRGGAGRFRGLRLVHTHLKGEPLSVDDLNDLALLRLDLIAAIEARPDGSPGTLHAAYVNPLSEDHQGNGEPFQYVEAARLHDLDFDFASTIRAVEEEFSRRWGKAARGQSRERAVLVGLSRDEDHLLEMTELIKSSGVDLASVVQQSRRRVHPRTVVGRGKLQEIVLEGMRQQAEVAVFDLDLKPAQARAFEDATGLKAIDRTQLILDIFAQRARSRDGKLQVELAQLKYSLPRLTEKDAGLSRLVGGIGGRGPGETVLEIGRRRIRQRIRALEKRTAALSRQRELRRSRRRREELPILSIVGYTNAGKSTLLNTLTNSNIATADQLFMTLDPSSRRLRFPTQGEVIITDTVGFISNLPADLMAAFRATLEELGDADLLLHVVDAADQRIDHHMTAVNRTLEEIGVGDTPRLLVLNKLDRIDRESLRRLQRRYGGVPVSARNRLGLEQLIEEVILILHHKRGHFAPGAIALRHNREAQPLPSASATGSQHDDQ